MKGLFRAILTKSFAFIRYEMGRFDLAKRWHMYESAGLKGPSEGTVKYFQNSLKTPADPSQNCHSDDVLSLCYSPYSLPDDVKMESVKKIPSTSLSILWSTPIKISNFLEC